MRVFSVTAVLTALVACSGAPDEEANAAASGPAPKATVPAEDAGRAGDGGSPLVPPETPDGGPPPPPVPVGPTATKSYQQGVDGYAGTRSVGISTYGGLGNVGAYNANGSTFADGDNDWCTGIDIPQGMYSEVWLLRFEDLGLPASAQIVEAKLAVHAYASDASPALFLAGSYLAQAWYGETPLACAGCSNSPVGWRYRNGPGQPWGALGAAQSGTDYLGGKSFRLPDAGAFPANGSSTPAEYVATLDASVVQGWLAGSNFGVRIVTGTSGVHVGYVQPQRSAGRPATLRPKLTITYATP